MVAATACRVASVAGSRFKSPHAQRLQQIMWFAATVAIAAGTAADATLNHRYPPWYVGLILAAGVWAGILGLRDPTGAEFRATQLVRAERLVRRNGGDEAVARFRTLCAEDPEATPLTVARRTLHSP